MYPNDFDYYAASTTDDALSLLEEHTEQDPTILAGGHSLIPTIKFGLASPAVVVDISDVDEMQGIEHDGDRTIVGAATRYADVVDDDRMHECCPAVAQAASEIGDTQVRNRGTFGGNVAHADPASDLPAATLAADATFHARGPDGERTINADDFFIGIYTTALEPDELLTQIELPAIESDVGTGAYVKKPSPSSGYAMIGVAVRLLTDGDANGTITDARLGANGALDHAIRLESVEDALVGNSPSKDLADDAASRATDDVDESLLMDDSTASPAYRAQLLEVYTRRAITTAFDQL